MNFLGLQSSDLSHNISLKTCVPPFVYTAHSYASWTLMHNIPLFLIKKNYFYKQVSTMSMSSLFGTLYLKKNPLI